MSKQPLAAPAIRTGLPPLLRTPAHEAKCPFRPANAQKAAVSDPAGHRAPSGTLLFDPRPQHFAYERRHAANFAPTLAETDKSN